jgi:Holliday junction resolvase
VAKEFAEPPRKPAVDIDRAATPEATKPGTGRATAKEAPPNKTTKPTSAAADRDEFHQNRPRSNNDPRVTYKSITQGRVQQQEFHLADYTEDYYRKLDDYNEALRTGAHTRTARDAGEALGVAGADQYMTIHERATRLYRQTGAGGQKDLDLVYKKGDTYYVVEAKSRKASYSVREVPNEFVEGQPAVAIQGSAKHLQLTLDSMVTSTDPARRAIARELLTALENRKVVYLEVRTSPRANQSAYYSVKQYKINP